MYKKTLKTYKQRLFVYFLLLLNTLSSCRWQVGECGLDEHSCAFPGRPGHGRYVDPSMHGECGLDEHSCAFPGRPVHGRYVDPSMHGISAQGEERGTARETHSFTTMDKIDRDLALYFSGKVQDLNEHVQKLNAEPIAFISENLTCILTDFQFLHDRLLSNLRALDDLIIESEATETYRQNIINKISSLVASSEHSLMHRIIENFNIVSAQFDTLNGKIQSLNTAGNTCLSADMLSISNQLQDLHRDLTYDLSRLQELPMHHGVTKNLKEDLVNKVLLLLTRIELLIPGIQQKQKQKQQQKKEDLAYLKANQKDIKAQLMDHLATSSQAPLQQLQEALHLPPHVLTPENLAHQAILGIQDFLQGTYPFMPLSASASSGSGEPRNNAGNIHQTEADDLAKQILDEFEKKKDLLSSEQQEELKQIKVEDLRPYTTILIETLEKLKHLEENEIPAEVDEASDEEPIIHPIEPNKDDMLQQQIYVPLLEQQHPPTTIALQYVIPTTYAFIPNYRTGNVNRIKQGFTRLKTRLDIFKTSILPKKEKLHLSEMHAKNIKYLLDEIQTEEKELIPLYRNIKSRISKCGGDSLFLTQDTSQFKEYELEKFKHEAAILQTAIDDVAHARKLLVDLGDIKQALRQILMDQDILYNVAYRLRKCGISKIITAQMLKLCAMQHNADIFASPSIISTLLDCVPEDELSNFENDYSEQELHAYFQSLKKVVSTDREKHFVALLHHRDHSAFASIMQRLGQPEPISKQDFVDLLHASTPCWDDIISAFSFRTKEMVLPLDDSIKYFAQITTQIINESTALPLGKTIERAALFAGIISLGHFASTPRLITVEERISYITPMILQAIIQSTPRPLGNTIMLTSMQEIKKRVHKLTGAIEQKLTQPILMLTNGNA
jgi:hypothetical protein